MQFIGKLSSTKGPRNSKSGANFRFDKFYCALGNQLHPVYHSLYFSIFLSLHITKTCPCNIQRFSRAVKMKKLDKKNDYFLIFGQNIDCGYSLEPPQLCLPL